MKYFDGVQTSAEARNIFFKLVSGKDKVKDKEEIDEILAEYKQVVPPLIKKELEENEDWLTSDPTDFA